MRPKKKKKSMNRSKDLPKSYRFLIIGGTVNSYTAIRATDCWETFIAHERRTEAVKSLLNKYINNSHDLSELYDYLNDKGVNNIAQHFSFLFNKLERVPLERVELNIWDFRFIKKLFKRNKI